MRKLFFLSILVFSQVALFAQSNWTIDNVHSSVKFTVSHLVISEVEGAFKSFSGTIVAKTPDFTDAAIDFSVDVNSISTENEMRDKHLKSPDFFEADKYPKMTFKSKSFKKVSGSNYVLNGDLTIHGITKPAKFEVVYGGNAKDFQGNVKAGFKATTVIDRFDYSLKWNSLTEAGGAVVGKDVTIILRLEFTQGK
jgi:polyisoprenoid-binding protein YceI